MEGSVVTDIFSVFTDILNWLIQSINTASGLFWQSDGSGLTMFGGVAVIGVGIAVVLLVIALIRSLIRLR